MEDAYKNGKLRAIGISNFMPDKYLSLVNHCHVVPAVNQVETHVFRQQKKRRGLECQIGTKHESWSPLACGKNNIFANDLLQKIGKAHKKTAAQVALRFLLQQNIAVIPKSTHREHMQENLELFDFSLDADEMRLIEQLDEDCSLFGWW
jgi:diketogulonate reductase-like aldo/keto reductase